MSRPETKGIVPYIGNLVQRATGIEGFRESRKLFLEAGIPRILTNSLSFGGVPLELFFPILTRFNFLHGQVYERSVPYIYSAKDWNLIGVTGVAGIAADFATIAVAASVSQGEILPLLIARVGILALMY